MIEAPDIQSKLLSLFRYDPDKSFAFSTIQSIVIGLAEQHFRADSTIAAQAPYKFFMPLVRMGLVEFVGKGKYQISPTVLLRRDRDYALVNGYESLHEELLKIVPDTERDRFGVLRFRLEESSALDSIIQPYKITVSTPNVIGHLLSMKRMKDIILGWDEYLPTNNSGFQMFKGTQGWKTFRAPLPGTIVGYSNPGGQRYIIDGNGVYHRIPKSSDHPDSFNIAVCACRSIEGHSVAVGYDRDQNWITLDDHIFLPIMMDRLLRIHNIFDHIGGTATLESGIQAYNGSALMAAQLNRIFN